MQDYGSDIAAIWKHDMACSIYTIVSAQPNYKISI